jgi:hypothetical protein
VPIRASLTPAVAGGQRGRVGVDERAEVAQDRRADPLEAQRVGVVPVLAYDRADRPMESTRALLQHAPHNAMTDPGEIERFRDRCSELMGALLDELASAPDLPRTFPEVEDALGWPRRRIASVLGGVSHLRHTEFGGRRPYRFLGDRESTSGRWEIWMDATQAAALRGADPSTVA